jgi:NAD(P)-dependent dehydrogenase (short-subunit alcohol dehydrogenase family)
VTAAPVALVAGAGRIGREIADRLAVDGHVVGLTDVDAAALDGTAAARTAVGDATDPADVDRVVADVEATLGPVEVLVNALGTYGPRRSFVDSEPDAWWRVQEVNVRGPALLTRRVLPGMLARARGHVVNLASRAATWDDPGGSSVAYSTSKAALRRFTSGLAAELAGTGVVVVDLSPGFVRTAMTADRPGIDELPEDAFVPPTRAAAHVAALASGRYDALHGRFVHVEDDLDQLVAELATA